MRQKNERTTKYESITCVTTTKVLQNMKAFYASEPRGYYKMWKHYTHQNHEGTTKRQLLESITCFRTTRVQQNMKALHASEPREYNKYESITCFRTTRVLKNTKAFTRVRTTRVQQNMKALYASEPRGNYKIW